MGIIEGPPGTFLGIVMDKVISNKSRIVAILIGLLLLFCADRQIVYGQQLSEAQRLNELKRLRDELRLTNSLRDTDVTVIISERTIMEAARQIVGLEILLSNGSMLRVTSVDGELKPAAAIVKIGVQAKSSVTLNLELTGRLGTGEIRNGVFQMPFRIVDVSLMNGRFSSLLLKTLLGAWLSPGKWEEELPPLEIPLEINEAMRIPPSRISVEGSLPMEISTPEYRSQLQFALTSLFVLDKRLVVGLRMMGADHGQNELRTSFTGAADHDPVALENEVARLGDNLTSSVDLRVRLSRRVISRLLEQIAAAHTTDFDIRLKTGRVRAEEVTAVVKVLNYTDVEGGDGQADISRLSIDQITDGKVNLRLSAQGGIDARLRGREYGIPYRLSPRTVFSIRDRIVPLQFVSQSEGVILRAMPGASLPIDLRFIVKVAGRNVGINRHITVQVDRWLNRVSIPSFFGREISLPRKMEVDAGGNVYITRKQKINFNLAKMRVNTSEDAINMISDAAFTLSTQDPLGKIAERAPEK
jgi:hypothetical protein